MVVRGEVVFQGDAPTNSHLIRTVITEASRGRSTFSWQLEPQSVQSGGKPWRSSDSRVAPYSCIKAETCPVWTSGFTFT